MLLGFFWLSTLCIAAGILTLLWLPSLIGLTGWIGWCAGLAAGFLVTRCIFPALLELCMGLCECSVKGALTAWHAKCLCCVKDVDLHTLTSLRSELYELLQPLLTEKAQTLPRSESRLDQAPRSGIWKRLKADWHERFL